MSILPEGMQLWLQSLPFTFLPGLLLFLALPLAFIVLLLRRQRLDVGSLLLFRDLPQRTLFQNVNLEHLWHRWIYVFIFGVLALIAAGLSLPQPGQRHLVVLDDSASMGAWVDPLDHDKGTFWDLAKERARAIIDRSSSLGRTVVLVRLSDFSLFQRQDAQRQGDAVSNLANALQRNNLPEQLNALEAATVRVLPVTITERLKALEALAEAQGIGRVSVLTDRPLFDEGTPEADQAAKVLDWVDVSQAAPAINLAIMAVEEKRGTFDRPSRVLLQNMSNVPVMDAELTVRSVNNPVELPLLRNIVLAPNESLELAIETLRRRAEVLGRGPLLLKVAHPADALSLDNQLWLVKPSTPQMQVALVQCQGSAPLFDRLAAVEGLRWSYFGEISDFADLGQQAEPSSQAADVTTEPRNEADNPSFLSADQQPLLAEGSFKSFDLVIYDRCDASPLYEELETNSIVIEAVVDQSGDPDAIDEAAAEAVVRVQWQAPSSRSPVLKGLRSLIDMPLPSQTVRLLPQTHAAVGLLSDLDPAMAVGSAENDFFAPTDLLQSFVAWNGMKEIFDEGTGAYRVSEPDPTAPKMLYMGFDPHTACLEDVANEKPDKMPLAEALAASQNGPDDCLSMLLMVVNTMDWMRERENTETRPGIWERSDKFRQQYLSTGETLNQTYFANETSEDDFREQLLALQVRPGEAGARRELWQPLALKRLDAASNHETQEAQEAIVGRVRWVMDQPGLYQYNGSRAAFDVSVGLLNAQESRLERQPIMFLPEINALAGAGRQDLTRLLVLLLSALMVVEGLIILFRGRSLLMQGLRSVGPKNSGHKAAKPIKPSYPRHSADLTDVTGTAANATNPTRPTKGKGSSV